MVLDLIWAQARVSLIYFLIYAYGLNNDGNSTLTVFFDLKNAFDTIDHQILLAKLKGMGFKGACFKLMENYLTNRTQCCKANRTISQPKMITCGMPQGSTLGPLLFTIYINDVSTYIHNVHLHAD